MSSISVRFYSFSSLIRFSMIISRVPAVVGLDGFEPSTSRLSGARSNHLSYKPFSCGFWFFSINRKMMGIRTPSNLFHKLAWLRLYHVPAKSRFRRKRRNPDFGGDDGNRTHDPLLAGQVLSQLSYTPIRAKLSKIKNS